MLQLFALENTTTLFEEAYKNEIKNMWAIMFICEDFLEISNYCTKDCFYCGIRKSNSNVNRYTMEKRRNNKSSQMGL